MAEDYLEQWVCSVCGYVHDDEEPPDQCPVCAAPANNFVEYLDENDTEMLRRRDDEDDDEFYGEFDEP